MVCKNCHNFFIKERKFSELFLRRKIYLCADCLSNIKLDLLREVIPLDNGFKLIVYHLYKNISDNIIDYLVYEYSVIYSKLYKINKNIIIVDKFNVKELEVFNMLNKLINSDIIIFSFM